VTTIAITGAGGQLGRRLVRALDADPAVTRIVGLDRSPPRGLVPSRFEYRPVDVRDTDWDSALAGVDVLVHLAFVVDPVHDLDEMRASNVVGTRNVFEVAARAGVERIVYPSSVVAYGAHPDNDVPLTESSPLRGIAGFPYAEHKRDIEQWLTVWREEHPDVRISVLRFALLLGPGLQNFVTRSFEAPRIPLIRGHRPPLQFLHPDDAVGAIEHAIDKELDGTFNVCADGWLSFDEVTAIVGRRTVEVPEELAWTTAERVWALGLGEQPPGLLSLFMYPWVMSGQRFLETGWRPRHSNRDAVAAMAAEHTGYVSLLGLRAKRRTVRLVVAAVVVAKLGLGWWAVKRWRSR
jgi:nucleoside-diphosphate-sugar epimerase